MLETIREYGREALAAPGEAEVTHQAHAAYYLALAEAAELAWHSPQQAVWMARLEQEHDNLRASMNWLLERGEAEMALRLGTALWWFWYAQEHLHEGWNELSRALERHEGVAVPLRARALWAAGSLAGSLGHVERGEVLCQESLALFRGIGDTKGMGDATFHLAHVAFARWDLAAARSLFEESLVIEQSHTLWQEVGNQGMLASTRSLLGKVLAVGGDHTAARTVYEESLLRGLAVVDIAPTFEGLAVVAVAQGETTWAVRLWAAAAALRDSFGTPLPPVYRADYERSVAAARAHLGEKAFAAAWAEGCGMTWEQALAARGPVTTLRETPSTPPAKSPPTYPDGLTGREVEVLRLLAQGLTDAQIAAQLIISPRTVNTHLKAIYGKIQVSSRVAATRYALEQHLS